MKKRKGNRSLLSSIAIPVLAAAVLLFFLIALGNLGEGQRTEGKEQLEAALRRTAVACYAAEGIYPPNLDYIKEYYGIQIDESRYTVAYHAFAENLMPDITVLEKR